MISSLVSPYRWRSLKIGEGNAAIHGYDRRVTHATRKRSSAVIFGISGEAARKLDALMQRYYEKKYGGVR